MRYLAKEDWRILESWSRGDSECGSSEFGLVFELHTVHILGHGQYVFWKDNIQATSQGDSAYGSRGIWGVFLNHIQWIFRDMENMFSGWGSL